MKKGMLVLLIGMLGLEAVASGQRAAPAAVPDARRPAIRMMEAVLSQAVRGGAERLAEQLGGGNPNMSFFTGQARARGFLLDGYGVFFHVEVPEMLQGLVTSVATLERDLAVASAFESLQRAMDSVPASDAKVEAEQLVKNLQVLVAPPGQLSQQPVQTAGQPGTGAIRATSDTPAAGALAPVPSPFVRDPGAVYRDAIKSALIDAMLDYSRGMNIRSDEWLTVAANRGDSSMPDEIVTSATVVLRIRGSDLAIYEADRTQKDEIRKRVEVREF